MCVNRIAHRKWNRGRNGLPKLMQTATPSIPFPVYNAIHSHSILHRIVIRGRLKCCLQGAEVFPMERKGDGWSVVRQQQFFIFFLICHSIPKATSAKLISLLSPLPPYTILTLLSNSMGKLAVFPGSVHEGQIDFDLVKIFFWLKLCST